MEVTEKQIKALIARRHPEYESQLPHWDFLEACYRGGRAWFKDHIFRYFKEGDGEFRDRLERAYRFNHAREVVDLVNKYVFKAPILRDEEDASQAVRDFWASATRDGLTIDQYMRNVSLAASTMGRVYLVVDNTAGPEKGDIETVEDEKEVGVRTYSYLVYPQHVLDMSYNDDDGEIDWILIHETSRDDKDPFESTGEIVHRYRLWTRTYWSLFEVRKEGRRVIYDMIDSRGHDLGEVPVIPCNHIETGSQYSSPSLIGDIAYLDRAVANYLSNLDAIIQDQTFSQLAMPAQGLMPDDEAGLHKKLVEMGTKRVFTYDGEGGAQPFYLSPDPKQAELIVMVIKQIINEIYHSVGMAGERTKQDNAMGIDNSSGVAKAYDFERVNALLTSKADSLDRTEERLVRLVNKWNGIENDRVDLIKYADNFDVRGLYDEFDVAERLSLIDAPESIRREQLKLIVEKLFPRLAKALKDKMIADIGGWPSSDEPDVDDVKHIATNDEEFDPSADGQAG